MKKTRCRNNIGIYLVATSTLMSSPITGFSIIKPFTATTSNTNKRHVSRIHNRHNYILYSDKNRYDEELERTAELKAREKATGSGAGETAAGAILGGLILGPFGALFGASIGSSLGGARAIDKAKKEELDRLGVTAEMLESAREMGAALDRSVEGLQLTRDSFETQQRFAKRLDLDAERVYDEAKEALENGDEERARDLLLKKKDIQEKLKKTLIACAEEKKRLSRMEDNVRAIEERAVEMESLMKRNIGAKAFIDSSEFSLTAEDPLLQKFRDMGID
mmetsp:Transcript_19761/g.24375  ORF Transcript_19761/g.24375 Transcript_19761/m.24375 type:complete len:278 (-) Transcript_19761:92-925(-)